MSAQRIDLSTQFPGSGSLSGHGVTRGAAACLTVHMEFPPTDVTSPHREKHRITYEADVVLRTLDEALICHVGFDAGGPLVLPMIHARVDDVLYVHVSTGSGLGLSEMPVSVCVTVSLVDGLVLAKSQFNHSLNYRCVVIRGAAELVTDEAEKQLALAAITEHVSPGRSTSSRPANARESAATAVLRIPLRAVSAKVRTGPPEEEPEDIDLPFWSGVIPTRLTAGPPQVADAGTWPEPDSGTRFRQ